MRIKAAGLSITVGDLREAIKDLSDNDQVYAHDRLLGVVEVTGIGSVELDPDVAAFDAEDLRYILEALHRITDTGPEKLKIGQIRELAQELIEEFE